MDVLSTLPDELILEIFQHIYSHRDAAAFAMQNKRFYATLGELVLRRRFRRIRVTPDKNLIRALNALLVIFRKPHLGHYVRHLEIDCHHDWGTEGRLYPDSLKSDDLNHVKRAIRKLGFADEPWEAEIFRSLFKGDLKGCCWQHSNYDDALEILTVLLASVSPWLESLSCSYLGHYTCKYSLARDDNGQFTHEEEQHPGSDSFLGEFLSRVGRNPQRHPFLRHLKSINFLPDTDRNYHYDEDFYSDHDYYHSLNVLRRLPAIESVTFEATEDSPQHMTVRPPPRRANYSKLTFNHSIIRDEVFSAIIESPKVLTDLTIKTGGRCPTREDDGHSADLNSLLKSLLVHRNTLERLDIDLDGNLALYEYHPEYEGEPYHGEESEWDIRQYELEWEDELAGHASTSVNQDDSMHHSVQALRSFTKLQFLGCGIHSLCYLAHGIGGAKLDPDRFSLVDTMPASLKTLRIYGYDSTAKDVPYYEDGDPDDIDQDDPYQVMKPLAWPRVHHQISEFMEQKAEKLPGLEVVEGVEEEIPAGQTLRYGNGMKDLIWMREIDEWTEYESE